MDSQKRLIAVQGLRRTDADTLPVLTQDVLRATLTRIDTGTLADLFALSELTTGLGVALQRDLAHFQKQMLREVNDLPDGPPLAEWLGDLGSVEASRVPATLRDGVARLRGERRSIEAVEVLERVLASWEGMAPAALVLPERRAAKAVAAPKGAPSALVPRKEVIKTREAPTRKVATPPPMVDERRAEWIHDEVLGRLEKYGVAGLKEAVLVAGAQHRAPWKDMTEDEILTVLRKLKRENRVGFTSGRWYVAAR